MLAMSGNQILMSVGSELGPIDPQFVIAGKPAPAQLILDQFEQAKEELRQNPSPAWLPMLQMYGPSLLQECQHHIALAEQLVSTWLASYMFQGEQGATQHAQQVAHKLNDHKHWRSHNRRIDLAWLTDPANGVKVIDLASNPDLEGAVRALFLAVKITLDLTGAFKIVENAQGNSLIGMSVQITVMPSNQPPAQTPMQPSAPPPGPSGPRHPPSDPSRPTRQLPRPRPRHGG